MVISHTTLESFLVVCSECESAEPSRLELYLIDASNGLGELELELNNSTARVEEVCGPTDVEALTDLIAETSDQMCAMANLVGSLEDFFRCSSWYPLYQAVVHETLCYSVDAYAWIAATQFAVVFLAMVVVTCRNVIYQDVEMELLGADNANKAVEEADAMLEPIDDDVAYEKPQIQESPLN